MNKVAKRRPTQADVARLASVSQAAVSQVLKGGTKIAISQAARQRVLAAAEQLGYVPDHAARSLRNRKTLAVAGIFPDITNTFYSIFSRSIQSVAEQHNYDLILYHTDGQAEKEWKCLRSVLQGKADGVVGAFFHVTAKDLTMLLNRNIFVVRLESRRQEVGELPLDNLYVDNLVAAKAAVAYLLSRGHTRIAMIVGRDGPSEARILGYRQALAECGESQERIVEGSAFTKVGGSQGMAELLATSPMPTAVFAANDLMAIGAMTTLREAGLRVPEDIAVIGFDDIPAAVLVSPALTTITQFPAELGQRAAEMLFERLQGSAPEGGRCEEMPYRLVVRESA